MAPPNIPGQWTQTPLEGEELDQPLTIAAARGKNVIILMEFLWPDRKLINGVTNKEKIQKTFFIKWENKSLKIKRNMVTYSSGYVRVCEAKGTNMGLAVTK